MEGKASNRGNRLYEFNNENLKPVEVQTEIAHAVHAGKADNMKKSGTDRDTVEMQLPSPKHSRTPNRI